LEARAKARCTPLQTILQTAKQSIENDACLQTWEHSVLSTTAQQRAPTFGMLAAVPQGQSDVQGNGGATAGVATVET